MGHSHDGVARNVKKSEAAKRQKGDKGVVRYLKDSPEDGFWFGRDEQSENSGK